MRSNLGKKLALVFYSLTFILYLSKSASDSFIFNFSWKWGIYLINFLKIENFKGRNLKRLTLICYILVVQKKGHSCYESGLIREVVSLKRDHLVAFCYFMKFILIRGMAFGRRDLIRRGLMLSKNLSCCQSFQSVM